MRFIAYDLGRRAVDVLAEEIDRDDVQAGLNARVHRVPLPVRERDSVAPPGS
jgi:LacI family transcriptional regulator